MKKIVFMMIGAALVSVSCSPATKKSSNSKAELVQQQSAFQRKLSLSKRNTAQPGPTTQQIPTNPTTQQIPTNPTTQLPTNPTTQQVPTNPTTQQVPTNPTTQLPTNPTTQLPTNPTTQLPTKPTTQLPTNPTTQLPTNPTTNSLELSSTRQPLPTSTDTPSPIAPSLSTFELSELNKLRTERNQKTQLFNDSVKNLKAESNKYQADSSNPSASPDRLNLNRLITARDTAKQKLSDFNSLKGVRLQELESKPGAPQEKNPIKPLDDIFVQAK